MKVLILTCAFLGLASAQFHHYGYHIPVIGHNGAPLETPEVQAAKIQHFAAHAEANARSGHYAVALPHAVAVPHAYGIAPVVHNALPADTPEVAAAKLQHYSDYAVAAQRNGVHVAAPLAPITAHPIDTPEVQLAKAAHFAAHAAARSGHYRRRRQVYYNAHIPAIGPNGVPVDTPDVQLAKASHFAAHAAARGHLAPLVYSAPLVNALPRDTPEVEAAKAHHFAAHAEALTRSSHYSPIAYAAPYAYYGAQAAIGHDGQPVETPEVQAAKASHFAAHAAARSHYY